IVENCLLQLAQRQDAVKRLLTLDERLHVVFNATQEVFMPSLLSVLVVILVNVPILALTGVEGKMFTPMAAAVIMALIAALILSLTFVPAAVALFLTGPIKEQDNYGVQRIKQLYSAALKHALHLRVSVLILACVFIVVCGFIAGRLGHEFMPNLDEGDVAVQALRIPGTSLSQSLDMQFQVEKAVLQVPEVKTFFSRVGTAEVASDPMGPNIADGYVMLKDNHQWPQPKRTKAQVVADIEEKLSQVPGNAYEISQPIQLRFNELISGVRSDLGIKLYGDDLEQLLAAGNQIAALLTNIPGAQGVKVEQVDGLPILSVDAKPQALLRYGLNISDVQHTLAIATGGETAGQVFVGDQRFA
ncbi:MAG TPA: efflux RND transporter permease subunit, partial [Cellvibrionaceae bacterium]|nr:efflux RND transporter permease subunit [Cellvibrionaceae bacterium]